MILKAAVLQNTAAFLFLNQEKLSVFSYQY